MDLIYFIYKASLFSLLELSKRKKAYQVNLFVLEGSNRCVVRVLNLHMKWLNFLTFETYILLNLFTLGIM